MKPLSKNIIFFVLSILLITAIFSTYTLSGEKPKDVGISTLVEQIKKGDVVSIDVTGNDLEIHLKNEDQTKKQPSEKTRKESGEPLSELLTRYGVSTEQLQLIQITVRDESRQAFFFNILLSSLLPLALLGLIFWFVIRQLQGANSKAMSFGQSGAREVSTKDKDRVTFKDVAGAIEAKEELMEEVEFLKNPKKFVDLGAKIPKGVLLMGSPGTGKTLLARAVAGEANVPFFHISGSEFVEMFVGVGAARVRDLFSKAKKNAPCIIFIDEIDAVGRQRGAGLGGSHDEREQTLNQILVEMDGFDPHIGVIVIAATNRPDVLDPALLRPGRFDRQVVMDLPDINERLEILAIHAKNKPIESNIELRRVAERTPGFSGADLANLLNEAAIRAARHDRKIILMEDILDSIEKVLLGPERKSHILSKQEREVTAYHEGGHALVANQLPHADPVHKISIISRGRAAGYTLKLPVEDKKMHARAEFIDDLAVMLGGFVAEREVFGDITTGAGDDLRKATRLARQLVTRYGMSSNLGPRTFGEREEMIFLGREIHESRDYSEKMAEKIDEEINGLIQQAAETAKKILFEERGRLDAIARTLLKKETIEREEFEALMKEDYANKKT
ncbi:MAG: ATP-dependent zinc metalloprotease FtsH 1 [Candidatus Uhrbacteria bacterium GW2011_GWF2_41_16]|uniref:ATP-dependent zinc metalloprotease FtsH n=2 Tax=Candidatus Uhriibacteriota TaxID=1752732 RepID=A0A0G0VGB1_9BACT|nr:MAG: ATP-dependent zinc metalloprotease FtsH 1 [Candidatus Uhrbacteria bacterium GW2011_GWA2_41_10]KKR87732.1 MAG: ATP-dependent zinc metalloprotease FtsH 1 [Candidatus Uhrbacteria bacterium GW2011_GWC2_41_11]KKR98671.1 MAG: ATP-dependent zinc metalloprotease FtsH 1 [Candidatus Uhrbacteria bacterium GW2011_GWF2_41_16]